MLRICATHDLTVFDSWFDLVRFMIRPSWTLSTVFDSGFDPVRPMIPPCSTHDSNLFDSWFDYESTLFYPWFDRVRLMIRPCSTHDSTLLDSWFDPVWLMIQPWHSWFDRVWLMIWFSSTIMFVRLSDKNWTPLDRVVRIMSRTSQPEAIVQTRCNILLWFLKISLKHPAELLSCI